MTDARLQQLMQGYRMAREQGDERRAMRYGRVILQLRQKAPAIDQAQPAPVRVKADYFGRTLMVDPNNMAADLAAFRQQPEFDALIDHDREASAGVRAAVGSLQKPEDRLATVRKYYPDAQPHGNDNFVFTHPDTKRPTLYNSVRSTGLVDYVTDTLGDVASLTRDLTVTAGSIAGGAGGVIAGGAGGAVAGTAVAPGPGTVAGALGGAATLGAAGAAGGAVVAGSAFDALMNGLGLRIDSRSAGEVLEEAAWEAGLSIAGEGVGQAVSRATSGALRAGTPAAQRMYQRLRHFGVRTPPASVVTGDKGLARLQSAVEQTVPGAMVFGRAADNAIADTSEAVGRVVDDLGIPARTAYQAGEIVEGAAADAVTRFKTRAGSRYDKIYDAVEESVQAVELPQTRALLAEMRDTFSQTSGASRDILPALREGMRLLKAEKNGLSFSNMRKLRSAIGQNLDSARVTGKSASDVQIERLYQALTRDMNEAVKGVDDNLFGRLKKLDADYARFMNEDAELFEKIRRYDAPERVWKLVTGATRGNARQLEMLRRNFTPKEWGTVRASVLQRMGRARSFAQNADGDVFSVQTFVTEWDKMGDEAKDILFGTDAIRGELDELATLISGLKEAERFTNHSNTGGAIMNVLMLQALGGIGGAVTVGGEEGTIAGGVGMLLAPAAAARLLSSPAFVRWLATPVSHAAGGIATHIAKLVALSAEFPELRPHIEAYTQNLQQHLNDVGGSSN